MRSLLLLLLLSVLLLRSPAGATPARAPTSVPATPVAGTAADLAGAAPLPLSDERQAEFAAYVTAMLAKTGVPGAAVVVVQNGDVVYQQGFGVKEVGGSEPVTPDTLFMIGSITKPMTATMAATMVDDGKLAWDTPVVDLLPTFAVADPALTASLSVRNAFCACTGLPQRDPEFIFNSSDLAPERLITSVANIPLTAPLGEQFQYSNQLFGIGGYAAAAAASPDENDLFTAYVTAMQQRLLDPLGMHRSTFALDEVLASGDYAQPHGLDLRGTYHLASLEEDERHVLSVAPAGALWSSASEMARFIQLELARGLSEDGARVVSQANLETTWQSHVTIPAPPASAVPPEFVAMARGYGLGWVTGDYRGQRLLWHSGGTFGFSAQAAFLPDADLGLVILTNGINAEFFTLATQFRLFELVFNQPASFDPAISAAITASAEQRAVLQRQLMPVAPAAVTPYLGRYRHDVLGEVEIALSNGVLIFDAGEFQAELSLLNEPGSPVLTFLSSDLPLAGPATVMLSRESGTPVMTFTDPTTGEAYEFTFAGASDPVATPPA